MDLFKNYLMLVPFEKLSSDSKIWIYQSDKTLSKTEAENIKKKTEIFLTEWTAHGQSLQAGMQILHDQFIIIGVNESVNEASGCSIDKSVNHIRELEKSLNLNLLDRSKIALLNNQQVQLVNFSEIKNLVSNGSINRNTEVFDNAIVSKDQLETKWIKPASESWIKRYL